MPDTKPMRTEDRILHNIRADLIAMAKNDSELKPTAKEWRAALACNLRALANLVDEGRLPDPFPIFRH